MIDLKDPPPAFVTYGWCRTAYAVIRSLGSKGVPVHVGDSSKLAMCRHSRYVHSFTQLPDFFLEPEEYFEQLCQALIRTGARVLLPAHEDIGLVIRWRDRLPPGVRICAPSERMWEIAEDKSLYVDHVGRGGCPVPRIFMPATISEVEALVAELPLPIVIKTRVGNSAKGVRICRERIQAVTEYFRLVEDFSLPPDRWPIIQEHMAGEKIGVAGYFYQGRHVTSHCYRIVRSKGGSNFGTSTYRHIIHEPVIQENAIRAMQSLEWNGVFDMDWLRDESGTARLIDINGRMASPAILTVVSGMEMPFLWYLGALGLVPEVVPGINPNTKARWILGDAMGFISALKCGRLRECVEILRPHRGCYHDDLLWSDPLPFLFQLLDYSSKFIRSGGSMNPTNAGMIR